MKIVILAGGFGTRISEESQFKPKPMIEIGEQPILWHIMKSYSYYGYNEFIICCGYKGQIIKEYFMNYYMHHSDVTFDFAKCNEINVHTNVAEPWKVTIVDTGLNTMTGGRLKRVKNYLNGETFMFTYGDGVCDLNIRELERFHKAQGRYATLTAVQPGGRFGTLEIDHASTVNHFAEKRREDGGWINGGFMILEPIVLDYIDGDNTTFERDPLERLSAEGQLSAFMYDGFWQCMDTLRDKLFLDELIEKGAAPWMVWEKEKWNYMGLRKIV